MQSPMERKATEIRRTVLETALRGGKGHIPPAFFRARGESGGVFGTPDDDFTMTVDDKAIFDVRVRERVLFGEPSIEIVDEERER